MIVIMIIISISSCLVEGKVPRWITKGRTLLIQKDKTKGNEASNYRPITCLPIALKVLNDDSELKQRTCFVLFLIQIYKSGNLDYLCFNSLEMQRFSSSACSLMIVHAAWFLPCSIKQSLE